MICFRLCWCFSGNCLQSKRCLCLSHGRFPPAIQALAHWKVPEGWLYAICRKCRICLEIFGMLDMFGDIWQDPLKKKGSITLSFSSSQKGWLIKVLTCFDCLDGLFASFLTVQVTLCGFLVAYGRNERTKSPYNIIQLASHQECLVISLGPIKMVSFPCALCFWMWFW